MFRRRTAAFTRESEERHARADEIWRAEAHDLHEMSVGARVPLDTVIAEIFGMLDQIGYVDLPAAPPPSASSDSDVIILT
jgi:hypothetical protein